MLYSLTTSDKYLVVINRGYNMAKVQGSGRSFIRCINCGEIMTGFVSADGSLQPVGLSDEGKCGEGEFELLTGRQ